MAAMLTGIRVLSFTHFLQGPSASQLLADLGADVIKIEPLRGAFERNWSAPDAYLGDASVFFLLANRNVRSFALDLKADQARDVIKDLVRTADVLIESFRPGAMERLGLGHEALSEINPRLVYCSLSGYGSSGPYRDRPGQDVLLQAMSGIASATGRADHLPTPVGASLVDQHGAVLGVMGILASLLARERSGKGCLVESNLLSSALDLQIEPLGYFLNGFTAQRSTSGISSQYYKAPYGIFETSDGTICLSLNSLQTLADVFDDPWFVEVGEDESLARREDVNERIAAHVRARTRAEWESVFDARGVWFAPVNDYEQVSVDPQVEHNRSIIEYQDPDLGEVRVLGHPLQFDGERPGLRSRPPRLGQHSIDVLRELGYDDERIEALRRAEVIGSHD